MSELVMINKRHESMNGQYDCLFDDGKMEQLISVIKSDVGAKLEVLTTEIKHVSVQQRDMLRWVLAVLCIIALGKGLLEVIEGVWAKTPPAYIKPQ